jgi:hypothetical protein
MSLVRDRYEQAVRHSWLMHQPDNAELVKYIGFYYLKMNKIYAQLDRATKRELQTGGINFDSWVMEKPSKEQQEYLGRWESLDLASMAAKRDALLTDRVPCKPLRELGSYYTSIYRQFSSVSHSDMYSMTLLGLHKMPDGDGVALAPDPWWPAILSLHTSLFDIIQCSEASALEYNVDRRSEWQALFERWKECKDRMITSSEDLI